jgi:hypothetical protein
MVIHIKTKRVGASLGTGERRVAKRKRTDLNSLSPPPQAPDYPVYTFMEVYSRPSILINHQVQSWK